MIENRKSILAGTMAASLLMGGAGTALAAEPAPMGNEGTAPGIESVASVDSATARRPAAEGLFSYNQETTTPNDAIRNLFRRATAALCQGTEDFASANPLGWQLSVTGEVAHAFTADVGELATEESVQSLMTCTCGGNPADGAATITADVKGIPVTHLLDRAEARSGVNTLTFVASDGTEVSMPLAYVVGHHGVLSYEINGEDLSASVGGNNQLWMTQTSANYFVRDIVEVRVTREDELLPNPGEGMEYPNSPNVGILAATVE